MNIDEMRKRAEEGAALADKATPGPWGDSNTYMPTREMRIADVDGFIVADGTELTPTGDYDEPAHRRRAPHNARFIRDARTRVPALAADVLALIAEVERLKASREEARQERDEFGRDVERITKERDAAKAEIERLAKANRMLVTATFDVCETHQIRAHHPSPEMGALLAERPRDVAHAAAALPNIKWYIGRILREQGEAKAEIERLRAVVAACDVDMMRPPMIG